MKINYRKKFEEAQERAVTLEGRANFWEDQAGKWRNKCIEAESDAKHDLIVIQLQRDALVRLRKIADLAESVASWVALANDVANCRTVFFERAIWIKGPFENALSRARSLQTALAAEQVDAQIARKSVAKDGKRV